MVNKFVLNSTQIPNYILDDVMPRLGDTELRLLIVICRQTYGWHKESDQISYSQLIEKTGRYKEAVAKGLRSLRESGLISVTDKKGKILRTREECIGKDLFYKINLSSSKIEPHLFDNRSSIIEHTKETNTKVLSKDNTRGFKKPTCPLVNNSPLKDKYPNGHDECIEYYLSVEERRGYKFINKPKQFGFIHKILRAGYGFDEMNRGIKAIEKKYDRGSWDFGSMASWLEKGASNG